MMTEDEYFEELGYQQTDLDAAYPCPDIDCNGIVEYETSLCEAGNIMNKVTKEFIESQIDNVKYHTLPDTTITVAVITLKSGFAVTGESACVDPANFDAETGNKIAHENAFNKLWQLFGFELKQRIGGDYRYRLVKERDELAELATLGYKANQLERRQEEQKMLKWCFEIKSNKKYWNGKI